MTAPGTAASPARPWPGRLLPWLGLLLVLAAGVAFRLDDLGHWRAQEARAFVAGEPIPVGLDAYMYLSVAMDLREGGHDARNELRAVPESAPQRVPASLLPTLAVALSDGTSRPLAWVAALLPVALGPLLALPLFGLGRRWGGPVMGLTAALLGVLYPFYVARTNVGRFDTDCLNAFFATSSAYLFLRFGTETGPRRYLFCAAGLLNYGLFLWWWEQAPAVVSATTFLPLGLVVLLLYRPERREGMRFAVALGTGLLLALAAFDMLETLFSQLVMIQERTAADFPNPGLSIDEIRQPSLGEVAGYTTGGLASLALAFGGVVGLLATRPREAFAALSCLLLLAGTVPLGNRFVLFLIPTLALGTAFVAGALWRRGTRTPLLRLTVPALVVALAWPLYRANERQTRWPTEIGPVAAGMRSAGTRTPEDAVLWAWWDQGHALNYFARRATVNDGALLYGGERSFYNALPLAAHSQRLAANFMHFYVARGMAGLATLYEAADGDKARALALARRVLGAGPAAARGALAQAGLTPVGSWQGPEDWLRFFFPAERRPVYLFLDELQARAAWWWHWFGTWDVAARDGTHAPYFASFGLHEVDGRLRGSGGLDLDLQSGRLRMGDDALAIATLAIRRPDGSLDTRGFENATAYRFELSVAKATGVLMDDTIGRTVFNQLFLHERPEGGYFERVDANPPYYQLWRVIGDRLAP